jgi:hypothetical protein
MVPNQVTSPKTLQATLLLLLQLQLQLQLLLLLLLFYVRFICTSEHTATLPYTLLTGWFYNRDRACLLRGMNSACN